MRVLTIWALTIFDCILWFSTSNCTYWHLDSSGIDDLDQNVMISMLFNDWKSVDGFKKKGPRRFRNIFIFSYIVPIYFLYVRMYSFIAPICFLYVFLYVSYIFLIFPVFPGSLSVACSVPVSSPSAGHVPMDRNRFVRSGSKCSLFCDAEEADRWPPEQQKRKSTRWLNIPPGWGQKMLIGNSQFNMNI